LKSVLSSGEIFVISVPSGRTLALSTRDVEAAALRDAYDPRSKRLDLGVPARLLGVQHAIGLAGRHNPNGATIFYWGWLGLPLTQH
jgi:hypothetical protein